MGDERRQSVVVYRSSSVGLKLMQPELRQLLSIIIITFMVIPALLHFGNVLLNEVFMNYEEL